MIVSFQKLPWLRELVVANTLAKWKKLEPVEIDFSQDFGEKAELNMTQ